MVRIGTVPRLPAGTVPVAAVASAAPLRVTVALKPRDPAALAAYAQAVSDPHRPGFRRYLSVRQFARRFGAAPAALRAVAQALRRAGLRPGRATANGLSIPVRADAGQIERALDVALERVRLPNGRTAVVTAQAPAVAARIAGRVQAILGLNGLAELHTGPRRPTDAGRAAARRDAAPRARPYAAAPSPCAAARSSAASDGAYTADQIASAYRFDPAYAAGDSGQGVVIGVYELEPNDPADIAAYQTCYGTQTAISYVQIDGGAGSGAGSGEAALDIEQLIGLAPKARLVVYQAPNSNNDNPGSGPYDLLAAVVSQDAVQVLTSSWGECEAVEGATDAQAENTLLQEAAIEGITVVSAAGDNGSEDCDGLTPTGAYNLAVDDPGSQPYVTAVGGTSMTAPGPAPTETVWNSGGGLGGALGLTGGSGAGGGGISSLWPMPAYQSSAPASLNVIGSDASGAPCGLRTGVCREVPDVAADADPAHGYVVYYNGSGTATGTPSGWQATGGTSGAAPLWAALFALADAAPACHGAPVGFTNPTLYQLAASNDSGYFNDITSGNNDYTGAGGGRYAARPGYDMATGLGSPDAATLIHGLCDTGLRIGAPALPVTFAGTPTKVTVPVADVPGTQISFTASGLPAGLGIGRATGVISGIPRHPGSYTVTVTAADSAGAVRQVRFVWVIAARPRISGTSLTDGVLRLTVTRGRDEPPLARLKLTLPGRTRFTVRLRSAVVNRLRLPLGPSRAARLPRRGRVRVTVTITDRGAGVTTLAVRVPVRGARPAARRRGRR
jgi:subtilase family serine protease